MVSELNSTSIGCSVISVKYSNNFLMFFFFLCIKFFIFMLQELLGFVKSYALPEGFPDSVIPSYAPYMTWRALKVFISITFVFSTTIQH